MVFRSNIYHYETHKVAAKCSFFVVKKILLHVIGISAIAKSFATIFNVPF